MQLFEQIDSSRTLLDAFFQPDIILIFILSIAFGGSGALLRQMFNGAKMFEKKRWWQVALLGVSSAFIIGATVSTITDVYLTDPQVRIFIATTPMVVVFIFLAAGIGSPEVIGLLLSLIRIFKTRILDRVGATEETKAQEDKKSEDDGSKS